MNAYQLYFNCPSLQVVNELGDLVDWFVDADSRLQNQQPIASDLDLLQQQLAEQKVSVSHVKMCLDVTDSESPSESGFDQRCRICFNKVKMSRMLGWASY